MGKVKKGKRINSDAIHTKRSTAKVNKLNPFEVHVNREKFKILGRKCKHDRGLPGVSRAKAVKKRKQTLGEEYKEFHKTNKFKDNRYGSKIPLTDELATARFAMEKMNQFKANKKNIYNLNDEEVLTHRGQTLEEIEQFRDVGSDSEDEVLDADFTEAAHFGGEDSKTDRKAAIEEMIAEAKRKKAEAAKEKDEVYELTTKLDEHYKHIIPLMGKLNKTQEEMKPQQDDYDRVLKEMVFEPRGEVSDKLQSEEELIRKEKERLEKLEKERLARMKGEEITEERPAHKSADDLDDGYFAGSGEEEEGAIAYELNESSQSEDGTALKRNGAFDRQESAENNKGGDEELSEENDEEDENEEEEEDNLSDFKSSDSESEEEMEGENLIEVIRQVEHTKKVKPTSKTEKDLPYVYEFPASYDKLRSILINYLPNQQGVIIKRIIKCYHPTLDPKNREKMLTFFKYLLKYLDETFIVGNIENVDDLFKIFDNLCPYLFDLMSMNQEKASNFVLDVVQEKYAQYKKNAKLFPKLNTVMLFKLVSNLFSTSDFRHLVVTPCFIFISHVLSRAIVRTRSDVSIGLFLVTITLEYTQLSQRFLPAALNFLIGIIHLSVHKRPIQIIKDLPPLPIVAYSNNLLVLSDKVDGELEEEKLTAKDLISPTVNDSFKIRALNTSLKLIKDFIDMWSQQEGACYTAESFLGIFQKLDVSNYPEFVKLNFERAKSVMDSAQNKPLQRLVAKEKKPKALRMLEPRIEKVYDDKRRPKMSKDKEMRAILLHKVKRETKGAVREIRRDTAFLSKMQIKNQIQSGLERKEKVKRIYAEAAIQQGELNALSKKRKKL